MEYGTIKCGANYIPLSPISFLERAAIAYGDRVSVIHGDRSFTWKKTFHRCIRLASALTQIGVSHNHVVAALAPNVPAMYELHFGVPMAGAILSTLNTGYDSDIVSILLSHLEAKVIFVHNQFLDIALGALKILANKPDTVFLPTLILIQEYEKSPPTTYIKYESFLATGNLDYEIKHPNDECDPISISFTSGTTTPIPKGVVYTHRGTYLNSLSSIILNEMLSLPVYLWTVPMFHCNGWCMPWAVADQGGTNICTSNISSKIIFDSIAKHKVTHMGGAPALLNMITNTCVNGYAPIPNKVVVMTGGAPPPIEVLLKMEELGFIVNHCYGMTETYGPGAVCTWKPEWKLLSLDEQAKLKSRQGIHHIGMEKIDVKDPVTMKGVARDGKTIGEVMFKGNSVASGYFKNKKASEEAFKDGWFRTNDLAIMDPDGYIVVKDRMSDAILVKRDNKYISTIEVESVLFSHPMIFEAAVVRKADDEMGEIPFAFVKLKDGVDAVKCEDIIEFCKERLPNYMVPHTIIFTDLPKTLTGKTQKYLLRVKAEAILKDLSN